VDGGRSWKRSSFFGVNPFEFVEEDQSTREVGELDSYRKKPPESPGILDGVDDLLVVLTASPNR